MRFGCLNDFETFKYQNIIPKDMHFFYPSQNPNPTSFLSFEMQILANGSLHNLIYLII